MEQVTILARAKLNLTLEVTGRAGGYHTLDSLVAALDLSDTVTVRGRTDGKIGITMRGMGSELLPPEKNNAVRAAKAYFAAFPECPRGLRGADISVEKRIPVGGGLGGSSADAAGVLLALGALCGTEKEALFPLAVSLGSDAAAQLSAGCQRMRGRGEELTPVPGMPKLYFVLLCPGEGVSSSACFSAFDAAGGRSACPGTTERAVAHFRAGELKAAAEACKNDLTAAACALNREVKEALDAARSLSPLTAGMTGSGSTVFALFGEREARDRALERIGQGKFTALAAETISNEE